MAKRKRVDIEAEQSDGFNPQQGDETDNVDNRVNNDTSTNHTVKKKGRKPHSAATKAKMSASAKARHSLLNIEPNSQNQQLQSPFFTKLPAEIRNAIYSYLFTPVEHEVAKPPSYLTYYCDWAYTTFRTETAFLQACQRAYSETHMIPLRLATIRVVGRAVYHHPRKLKLVKFPAKNLQDMRSLHIHCDAVSWDLSRNEKFLQMLPRLQLEQFQITVVRYCVVHLPTHFHLDTYEFPEIDTLLETLILPISLKKFVLHLKDVSQVNEETDIPPRVVQKALGWKCKRVGGNIIGTVRDNISIRQVDIPEHVLHKDGDWNCVVDVIFTDLHLQQTSEAPVTGLPAVEEVE